MSTAEKKTKLSEVEYFAYEDSLEGLAEFFEGEVFDMSGGSLRHSQICATLTVEIGSALKDSGCVAYTPDARILIAAANAFVRPDLWVACGPLEVMPGRKDTALNPTLVAEVLSPSTANFDRTGKFTRYRMIPSLREYVLVEQDHPQVDVYYLNDAGVWEFNSIAEMAGIVNLRSIGISVPMAEIYRKVEWEEEIPPPVQ